jgi:hypothetical protein
MDRTFPLSHVLRGEGRGEGLFDWGEIEKQQLKNAN